MDIPPAALLGTRERGFSDTFAARPRTVNDRESLRHGSSPAGHEKRSPSNVPKGLENMLKTTTETGDIGMFSIRPPRVPQSSNTPRRMGSGLSELGIRKTRQSSQPYGAPVVDDRHRLPSYARDNASETLSMYDTGSQKSANRAFDDPDYRSYSMTQTYSSYTLSNHRSYTSLRSQPDGNGLVQRPRSPFAYPTRLRRPGFRPSSPALTDGGAVDYSRRVEIDRALYGPGHTASPSSLYAQKRKPPLSLRHEANRSTPSLLSQSSPPRRSSSPLVQRQHGLPGNDWQRRNATVSGNTSPARSTLSIASTVNVYNTVPISSSTTTTPGKLHPPSPLYYDYTEDFEVEVRDEPQVTSPPPQFRLEKTIPEDRPMSADGPTTQGPPNLIVKLTSAQNNHESHITAGDRKSSANISATPSQDEQSPPSIGESNEKGHTPQSTAAEHKKVIRLSGLGYGAQELSSHVEEAFGLPASSSFVIDVGKTVGNPLEKAPLRPESGEQFGSDSLQSARTSTWSIGSQFPQFPQPPGIQAGTSAEDEARSKQSQRISASHGHNRTSSQGLDAKTQLRRTSRESQCLPPSGRPRARSSGLNSVDTGLAQLTELVDRTMKPAEDRRNQASVSSHQTSMALSGSLDKPKTFPHRAEPRPPLLSSYSQQRGKELQMLAERQPVKRTTHRTRVDPMPVSELEAKDVPNFSHQIPHKIIARSESPMLAPKPISPARQLKLKNSIPQIMKTLPPLPADTPHLSSKSNLENVKSNELTYLFSPLATMTTVEKTAEADVPVQSIPKAPVLPEDQEGLPQTGSTRDHASVEANAKDHVPRLKLKSKASEPVLPLTPLNPEDAKMGRHQDNQTSNDLPVSKPKFRLKVTRASGSIQGTVRITRDSENTGSGSGSQGDAYPQSPQDLFTPSPGFENIFKNFGKHLSSHSRKSSANSRYKGEDSEPIFSRTTTSSSPYGSPVGDGPQSRTRGIEARSVFSDDSSQIQGHHGFKKHITNLRAKISAPYMAKSGSQSYDDITWRNRQSVHILPPPTNQSDSNLYESTRGPEIKPMRRFVERLHRQRLKAKVRSWIKGAQTVIARMKPKHVRPGKRTGG